MKILITGARGNFPTALIPRLLAAGHQLVLLDLEPIDGKEGCINIQADIRDAGAVMFAMQGCDAVIHAMAYHGLSAASRNEEDYYTVNVTGTQNVLRAMVLHNIRSLVFSSTDSVYGDKMRSSLAYDVMDEKSPCIPIHIYPLTKVLGEEICHFYARTRNFNIAILRYGCFIPADWKTAGIGRLTNWLDREDVAQANELALGAVFAKKFNCETFIINSAKPFTDADWPALATNPEPVIDRYYPGAVALLKKHGLTVPKVHHRYDITKAVTQLGYKPQHNFEQFLDRLQR